MHKPIIDALQCDPNHRDDAVTLLTLGRRTWSISVPSGPLIGTA